jgi:nitrogen regulatory protein PII
MKKIYMLVCATKHSGENRTVKKRNLLKMAKKISGDLQDHFRIKAYIDAERHDEVVPKLKFELYVQEDQVTKIIRLLGNAAHNAAADSYILVRPARQSTAAQAIAVAESPQGIPEPREAGLRKSC